MTDRQPQPAAGARVLVVEDDALVRDHVVALLRSLGHETVAAGNGTEALSVLTGDDSFDLLFSDVMMPGGISGAQLADAARRIRPGLPVLLTSGYPDDALPRGATDTPLLLAKPYRRAELQAALEQALDRG